MRSRASIASDGAQLAIFSVFLDANFDIAERLTGKVATVSTTEPNRSDAASESLAGLAGSDRRAAGLSLDNSIPAPPPGPRTIGELAAEVLARAVTLRDGERAHAAASPNKPSASE